MVLCTYQKICMQLGKIRFYFVTLVVKLMFGGTQFLGKASIYWLVVEPTPSETYIRSSVGMMKFPTVSGKS